VFDVETVRRLLGSGRSDEAADAVLDAARAPGKWDEEAFRAGIQGVAGLERLLPPLEAALRGDDAGRRNAARSALAALAAPGGMPAARARLSALVRDDADPDVRLLAATALGEAGHRDGRPALEAALADRDPNVAAAAADALGVLGDPRAVDALAAALAAAAADPWRRVGLVVALGRLHDPRAIPALAAAGRDPNPNVAAAAAEALGETGDAAAMEALRGPAAAQDAGVRAAALDAGAALIGAAGGAPGWLREAARAGEAALARRFEARQDGCAALLLGAAGTSSAAVRLVAAATDPDHAPGVAAGLALLPPEVALAAVLPRLADAPPEARRVLAGALPPAATPDDVQRLLPLLGDDDAEVRAAAVEALSRGAPAAGVREALE
jgi:HEAT repeat protein